MPKSYNKHYKDYRTERQSQLPHRNPLLRYRSLVTEEWHNLETRTTWSSYKNNYSSFTQYRGDREEDEFNLNKEVTERQIAELTVTIKALSWIHTPVCTGYRDGDSRRKHWLETVIRQLNIPNCAGKYDIHEIRKSYLRRNCTHDYSSHYDGKPVRGCSDECKDFNLALTQPRHESSPVCVLTKRGAKSHDYYWRVDPMSVDIVIAEAEAYKQKMIDRNRDIDNFLQATEYADGNWVYSVADLSIDNPYREFRLAFEHGLTEKRARQSELQAHLDRLQEVWDNCYSDMDNLQKEQDERDKVYRQRVERKAELQASLKVKQKNRAEERHAALVKEVATEMSQWREGVHSGKDTCGCTSAPNAEGIRTIKVNYPTLEAATAAAKAALINSNLHLRPYTCPAKKKGRDGRHYKCGGFHLSSSI